jgi:aarF domain-containing kinase
MLLLDNFVHSDLHPGNIMIKFYKPSTKLLLKRVIASLFEGSQLPGPIDSHDNEDAVNRLRMFSNHPEEWNAELQNLATEGFHPELVFIDTGLVTELNGTNQRNFIDLFEAIVHFDGYRAGKLMIDRCRTPQLAINTELFALKMQHLLLSVKRETFSLAHVKISDVLHQVLRAVHQHHVKMEGDFINTVLSVLLLEGIGRQLDPSIDLFSSSLPILRQLGRQMTSQESLNDLPKSNFATLIKVDFS